MDEEMIIPNGYHYVWSEEFNNDSVRFSDWNIEARPSGLVNNEFQEYVQSEENIFVKDGMLHIRPIQKFDEEGRAYYTSGLLNTAGKHEYLYGRFETRLKIPYGKGLIPFVKIRCDAKKYGTWPLGGQIDLMQIPCHMPHKQFATVHYGEKATSEQGAYLFPQGTDAACDFHVYSCEWVPGSIKFMVDDILFFEVTIDSPFDHPFYIEVGLAIGGSLAGNPDECTHFDADNSLVVDYIRVFQKDEYKKAKKVNKIRDFIAVCGSWDDAENFNTFLSHLDVPRITKDYVIAAFSFGTPDQQTEEVYDEMRFADFINNQEIAAIIVFAEMIKNEAIVERIVENAKKHNIPIFMLQIPYEGTINVLSTRAECFEEICRHMIEFHGNKKVEMFAGNRGNYFSEERIEIFKKVLSENDIEFDERMIHYADFWESTASQLLDDLLDSGYELPEAFICANDSMASGVLQSLTKHGYKVPDDIKLSGYDGIRLSQISNPSITSGSPDYSDFVTKFLDILDRWDTDRDEIIATPIKIGHEVLINHSCGCPDYNQDKWGKLVTEISNDNNDCFRHMLEMGKFVSNTIKMDNLLDAMGTLSEYLWLWKDQFYFIGLQGSDMKLRALFTGRNNEYKCDQRYIRLDDWLPNVEAHLDANSKENVLLFKQVRVQSTDFAFVCCAYEHIKLRDQQRFEEFALFVSAVVNSVYNNQKYIRANSEIERISEMDYLTGLYNRRGFFAEIDKRIASYRNSGSKLSIALFSVDMDGLKAINDEFGHFEGDAALSIFANILLRYTAGKGICARYGGDEFAFAYVTEDNEQVDIDLVRKSIEALINTDYNAQRKSYKIGASIGFAEAVIDEKFDMEKVISKADESMYLEKQRRKSKR